MPSPATTTAPTVAGTILLIEHDLDSLNLLQAVCVRLPAVQVMPAMQGSLGVELAQHHLPALILLDLDLPDVSGYAVLQRLRRDPRTRHIPIITFGGAGSAGLGPAQSSGVCAHLAMPLDMRRLIALLERLLA